MDKNQFSIHNTLWGTFLILLGLYFFAPQLGIDININFSLVWPFFLIIPGCTLWLTYLTKKDRDIGTVIPATILTMLGCIFLFASVTNWEHMDKMGFLFPLSIAMGFWFAWLLGSRHVGFLIPAVILTFASVVTMSAWLLTKFLFPASLIIIGLIIVFKNPRPQAHEPEPAEEKNEKKDEKEEEKE